MCFWIQVLTNEAHIHVHYCSCDRTFKIQSFKRLPIRVAIISFKTIAYKGCYNRYNIPLSLCMTQGGFAERNGVRLLIETKLLILRSLRCKHLRTHVYSEWGNVWKGVSLSFK